MNSKVYSTQSVPTLLLVCFFLDSIVSSFVAIPIGATAVTLVCLFVVASFLPHLRKIQIIDSLCLVIAFSIYCLAFVKFFIYQDLTLPDYSDASFFTLFLVTPLFLKFLSSKKRDWYIKKYSSLFFIVITVLIAPSFFSYESGIQSQQSNLRADSLDLEYLRGYHQGFFRHAHVASYFFSFLFVFLAFKILRRIDLKLSILLAAFSFFIVLYTGSRSGLYAIVFSTVISFVILHPNRLLSISVLLGGGVIAANLKLLAPFFEGSFVYQYFTFFITASENLQRLSRVIIWSSWAQSVSEFGFLEILIGRPFSHSFHENLTRIGSRIWFHNDWLNSLYSYGIIGVSGLVLAYVSLWGWLKAVISSRQLSLTVFMMCFFLSIVNGFYYYYPLLLLYLMHCYSARISREDV